MTTTAQRGTPASRSPWLFNAPIDLLVGAGLSAPVVMGLAILAGHAPVDVSGLVMSALCAAIVVPHLGASLLRAWRGNARRPALALVAVAVIAAPVVVLSGDGALEGVWTVAACVLPVHVALQLFRVVTIVLRRAGGDGGALAVVAAATLALCGVVSALTGPRAPLIMRGFLSLERGLVVMVLLGVVAVVLAMIASRRGDGRGLAFTAVAYGVAAVGWIVPVAIGGASDPQNTASNAFALAHGLQLLWLVLFLEPRIAAQTPPVGTRTFDPLAQLGAAVVVGALLAVDLPWIASRMAGVDLVTALLAAQGTLALAHALIDALAFRLKDKEIAGAAFGEVTPAPHGRAAVSNARAALVLVPGALIAAGLVVDVLQSWSVRPTASEQDLRRAEALHPYDARILLPQAVRAVAKDDADQARAVLGEIAIARAFSPAAARARFVLCVLATDASSSDPAAKRCIDVPDYLADDVDVLAMTARVALDAGRLDVAKQKALRAVALAPDEPLALGSLGMVEAKLKELPAKEHLLRAIEEQRKRTNNDPLTGDASFLEVGTALAEAHRTRKEHDAALAVLARVVEGSTTADRPRAALRALALRGHVLDENDDARGALDAYQRALRIAPFAKLPADEASLWLDYGALLRRSEASPAAQYASALKAFAAVEALAADHPDKQRLELVTTTLRNDIERTTPADVQERVRSDVAGEALKALSLAYDESASPPPPP